MSEEWYNWGNETERDDRMNTNIRFVDCITHAHCQHVSLFGSGKLLYSLFYLPTSYVPTDCQQTAAQQKCFYLKYCRLPLTFTDMIFFVVWCAHLFECLSRNVNCLDKFQARRWSSFGTTRIRMWTLYGIAMRWRGVRRGVVYQLFHEADWIEFDVVMMEIVNKAHFCVSKKWRRLRHVRTCFIPLVLRRRDDEKSIMMSNRIIKRSAFTFPDHVFYFNLKLDSLENISQQLMNVGLMLWLKLLFLNALWYLIEWWNSWKD